MLLMQELLTDADNFNSQFILSLKAESKILILSSIFLIDFLYFEDNDTNSNRNNNKRAGVLNGLFNVDRY